MHGLFIPPKPSQNDDFPGPFCWATQTPPGCRHFTGLSASLRTLELHSPPVLPNTMCMATSVSLPSKPRPPSGPSPRPLVQEASWMPLLPLLTRPHLEPEQCHYSVTTWIPGPNPLVALATQRVLVRPSVTHPIIPKNNRAYFPQTQPSASDSHTP